MRQAAALAMLALATAGGTARAASGVASDRAGSGVAGDRAAGGELLVTAERGTGDLSRARSRSDGCYVSAGHTQAPATIGLGEIVHVQIAVDVNCNGDLPRQYVLAIPSWSDAATASEVRDAARAFVTTAMGQGLEVGLSIGDLDPPLEVAPTRNFAVINGVLAGYGPNPGGAATAVLVGSARALLFADVEERLKHVIVLDHEKAAHATESRTRFEMEATLGLGMDVTHICLGAGVCPPLPGSEEIASAGSAQLGAALSEVATRPGGNGIRWARVRQNLGSEVDYVHASANIRPAVMGSSPEANFVEWLAEGPQDQVIFEFDVRPFAVGAVPAVNTVEVEALTRSGVTVTHVEAPLEPITVRPEVAVPSACRLRAEAEAAPGRVALFGTVTGTLTLQTDCPPGERDVDVVLAFDQSRSMEGLPIDSIIAAAERFVERIRLDRSRVAVMMFASDVEVRTGLISDRDALLSALRPMSYGGETAMGLAIDKAREILEDRRPSAMPAIVMLTDGHLRDDPLPAAAWAKAAGIRLAVVCYSPTLSCDDEVFDVASTQYLFLAQDADELLESYDALGTYMSQPDVQRLSVTLEPTSGLAYTGLTPHPNPPSRGQDGTLAWNRADALQGNTVLRLPLYAVGVGDWPLAESAAAYYVDSYGGAGAVSIPLPRVEVLPPAATGPCEPAATRSAEPSAVRAGDMLTVTSHLDVVCRPAGTKLDTVFALDHSFSMGTLGRLENAAGAVGAFMTAMADTDAWHGLVAFNEQVTDHVPLGPDDQPIRDVLDRLDPDGGTDIGRAMEAARVDLEAGRTGARRVMVVLTDGDNSASATPIMDAAGRAQEAGILVVTVCAGGNCDPDLARAASAPEYAFNVTDAAELGTVFQRLAGVVKRQRPATFELEETVSGELTFVQGSPAPVPAPWEPTNWLWGFAAPPENGLTLAHVLRADRAGRRPVALRSVVRYAMDGGDSGEFYMPSAAVDIAAVDPPLLPTAEPIEPPTPTPDPLRRIYLPNTKVP